MNATYESPNRPAVAFNGIEGLRLDSTEPPTSGDFKPTPVLAYRECRKTGPRIATNWAVFDLAGYELGGAVSENQAAVPAELLAVLDKLNQIDPAVLTEFEARSLYVRQCDPTQDGFDLAYQKEVALRPIEAIGIWGGRLCAEHLEKLAPTVAKVLNDINGPRRLTIKEQAEIDRREAAAAAVDRAAAALAAADQRDYELATGALLDAFSEKLPARLRAANVAQCVKAFLDNPRLFVIADDEHAFFDATAKDASTHADQYQQT